MRTEIAELMLQAAQRILDSAAAGRIYSDMTLSWARRIVAQNATTKGATT